jgi:hypothetical protein
MYDMMIATNVGINEENEETFVGKIKRRYFD